MRLTVEETRRRAWPLSLRIPAWCAGRAAVGERRRRPRPRLTRTATSVSSGPGRPATPWSSTCRWPPRLIEPHPRVEVDARLPRHRARAARLLPGAGRPGRRARRRARARSLATDGVPLGSRASRGRGRGPRSGIPRSTRSAWGGRLYRPFRPGAAPARQRAELHGDPLLRLGEPRARRHARVDPARDDTLSGRNRALDPVTLDREELRVTGTHRMQLGLMLPIGAGALGEGRPVRWADLREMARTAESVGDRHVVPSRPPALPEVAAGQPHARQHARGQGTRDLGVVDDSLGARRGHEPHPSRARWSPAPDSGTRRSSRRWRTRWTRCRTGAWCSASGPGGTSRNTTPSASPTTTAVGRFEEALAIIVPLLREGRVDFRGSTTRQRTASSPPAARARRPADPHRRPAPADDGARRPLRGRVRRRLPSGRDRGEQPIRGARSRMRRGEARPPDHQARGGNARRPHAAWRPVARRGRRHGAPGVSVFEFGGMRQMARVGTPEELLRT